MATGPPLRVDTRRSIAAEYGSISACSTQNKAKRANKIVFLLLIRDQEVDGSNPFAPTNLLVSATYKTGKRIERLVQGQEVNGPGAFAWSILSPLKSTR